MGDVTNDPHCTPHSDDQSSTQYRCVEVDVSYVVNGKKYNMTKSTDSPMDYGKGSRVEVFYDPSNPKHAELSSDNSHVVGWIALVMGLLVLIGSWFWIWMTWKYKFVAAAGGVAGAADMIGGALR